MKQITINLFTPSLRDALYFYEDLFGVERLDEAKDDDPYPYADISMLNTRFRLIEGQNPHEARAPLSLGLEVEEAEVDRLFERAIEREAEAVDYPSVYLDLHFKTATFLDPYGIEWILTAHLGD